MGTPTVSPVTTRDKKPAKAVARESSSSTGARAVASEPQRLQSALPPVPSSIPAHPPAGGPPLPSRHRLMGRRLLPLQRKLAIGSTSDPLEAEADAVADLVLRGMPAHPAQTGEPVVRRKCACEGSGKPCASCEEEDGKLMRRAVPPQIALAVAPPIVHDVLRAPGQPLDPTTRALFEPRFGWDFSQVRVHDGAEAAESARSVNALAYTVGNDVVFDLNQYQPESTAGQRLLAHELTHVVQQSREGKLRLRRKELPDQEIPKDWPLPNPYTEGTEKCRIEEGDFKCYKVKCKQTEEDKTHCYYDGPYTPEPEKKPAPPAPAAKQAVSGTDSKGQGYVVYEKEIRVGGTRPWRNNNPGNFDKPEDHPKNIGNDGRFLIFPDAATGKQELIDAVKSHGTSTIRSFITVHAPPSENPTETYITDVVGYMNHGDAIGDCKIKRPDKPVNDGTGLSTLSESEQTSFAFAMAREEGWCDVTQKKAIYNCQSGSIPDEYKGKLVCK